MQIIIEVKQARGDVREGVSNNKPWKMARQNVAVFVPGNDYPLAGQREIYVSKNKDGTLGEPEFMNPGRYTCELAVKLDKWGVIIPIIEWRTARVMLPQAQQKAA